MRGSSRNPSQSKPPSQWRGLFLFLGGTAALRTFGAFDRLAAQWTMDTHGGSSVLDTVKHRPRHWGQRRCLCYVVPRGSILWAPDAPLGATPLLLLRNRRSVEVYLSALPVPPSSRPAEDSNLGHPPPCAGTLPLELRAGAFLWEKRTRFRERAPIQGSAYGTPDTTRTYVRCQPLPWAIAGKGYSGFSPRIARSSSLQAVPCTNW